MGTDRLQGFRRDVVVLGEFYKDERSERKRNAGVAGVQEGCEIPSDAFGSGVSGGSGSASGAIRILAEVEEEVGGAHGFARIEICAGESEGGWQWFHNI